MLTRKQTRSLKDKDARDKEREELNRTHQELVEEELSTSKDIEKSTRETRQ